VLPCTSEDNLFAAALYLDLPELVEHFLSQNSQDTITYYGRPLYCAMRSSNVAVTRELLKRGFTLDKELWIPLGKWKKMPTWQCPDAMLRLLLEPEIFSKHSSEMICAGLYWAACSGNLGALQQFMSKLIDDPHWDWFVRPGFQGVPTSSSAWSTVMYVGIYFNQREVVQLALDSGLPLNYNTANDNTMIYSKGYISIAALRGHEAIARLLLAHRPPDMAKVRNSRALIHPLAAAARGGWLNIAGLLIENGADPNMHEFGWPGTALTAAVLAGQVDSLRFLLDNGLDYNKNSRSESVRNLAIKRPMSSILRLLEITPI